MRDLLSLILVFVALPALGEDGEIVTFDYDGSYQDAALSLTTAIEGQGLKVDAQGPVGEMLARTADVVGADELTYENAEIFQFCSATLSRKMMEINPNNIGYCPYQIFVYQLAGAQSAVIGYRNFPDNEMHEVEDLIEGIIEEALAF